MVNLIPFYNKIAHLVDEGKALDLGKVTSFPTAFSRRRQQPMAWTGASLVG